MIQRRAQAFESPGEA